MQGLLSPATRRAAVDVMKFCLIAGIIILGLTIGTERLGYHWQWYRVPRYLWNDGGAGPLLQGLWVTVRITAVGMVLALAIGIITALFRLSDALIARGLARVYLESIRNTPLLVQIFFVYFVIAPIIEVDAFTSAVLALSLFEGAYMSEIFRSGIVSVERGQWEAAYSLGMTGYGTYRHVIIPQAVRRILPPLTGQAISLIKDSALVSTIAIYDLTMQGQAIIAETFLTFEIWFTVAALYFIMTATISYLVHRVEDRFRPE
ncbi:MAG: amino acid ABC transporter permease [Deltaproteobacteria bacterium]|nr:amino acid ABC transporter permease [Deltaproteobacteria bacterium]